MTVTTRYVGKPDHNPGYRRSPVQVVRTKSGREIVWIDAMVLVELREDYRRAGLSWPGERG